MFALASGCYMLAVFAPDGVPKCRPGGNLPLLLTVGRPNQLRCCGNAAPMMPGQIGIDAHEGQARMVILLLGRRQKRLFVSTLSSRQLRRPAVNAGAALGSAAPDDHESGLQ